MQQSAQFARPLPDGGGSIRVRRAATSAGSALALLLFAGTATAQSDPAPAPAAAEKTPAPPTISYVGGQLKIDALNATLADVLTKVAALTGAIIDIPDGANGERMPVVELGPGPARQVLASLLSDSSFDYVIQASDTDPGRMQRVLLMPREKRDAASDARDAATRPSRSPYSRAQARPAMPEEAPPPEAQPEGAAAEAAPLDLPATPAQPAPPPPAPPDPSGQFPLLQPDPSNPAKPGALAPPQSLSPQGISQQLQQMYQQRMQMTQQDHFTGTQPTPAIPGSK